jgi:3-hydroxyisobutyrate dehydrogenase-like beta-hydroxyacid dehydrogenase
MPTLAYIGLGNMGSGMAKNLVEKGNLSSPLILYNRTIKKAEELSKELGTDKTKVASTIEDAVRDADIIYTCLGSDKAVSDTIASALNVHVAGKIFVECSTVSPDTTNAAAKSVEAKGASFVGSPSMLTTP